MRDLGNCPKVQVEVNPDQNVLTDRQAEVLLLRAQGNDIDAIAALMGIRMRTVKFHLAEACDRLGAVSGYHLIVLAVGAGVITVSEFVGEVAAPMLKTLPAILFGIGLAMTVFVQGSPRTTQSAIRNVTQTVRVVRGGREMLA